MAEYISREAVLEHLNKCKEDPLFDPDMARICFAISIFIENMQAADVQPVKRGKWDFQGYQLFKCTNCKEMFTQNQLEAMQNHKDCEECAFPNFCPECGADMRELTE